jgi:hypothetical protein
VAIKKLNMQLLKKEDEYLAECVYKEIEIQKTVVHENVLQILDSFEEGQIDIL